MMLGGTPRAPAMGVGSRAKREPMRHSLVLPAILLTPFVPQGRATRQFSGTCHPAVLISFHFIVLLRRSERDASSGIRGYFSE